jgi:hypothetical protein
MFTQKVRALVVGVLGLAGVSVVAVGCSSSELPPTPSEGVEEAPQHVFLRVPRERLSEFPEGSGLGRPLHAEEMNGELDWWMAFLPRFELDRLAGEGFEWKPIESGLTSTLAYGFPCSAPTPGTVIDKFCPYGEKSISYMSQCKRSISNELKTAATDFPPVGGTTYVQSFSIGNTFGGVPIRAVRVGKLWTSGNAKPQVVVYAAQHAREWAGPETLMRMYRYFARSYRDDVPGVRDYLNKTPIVFVPVMNPDGYDFTHTAATNRLWRPNRQPCGLACNGSGTPLPGSSFGTDPNRNFQTTFGQPSNNDLSCNHPAGTFKGPCFHSAQESGALLNLLANTGGLPGKYKTQFALNVHAYGNTLLLPEGLSDAPDFKYCTTNGNCTAPEHGVIQDLVGTELTTAMTDENTAIPYVVGQTFRTLYHVGGDSNQPALYGSPSRPNDPRFLAASIEITNSTCGFSAESIPEPEFDTVFQRMVSLTAYTSYQGPALANGSFFTDYQLPHLHRRQVSASHIAVEYPTIRVAAKKSLGDIDLIAPGETEVDEVRDGPIYRMWRFRAKESDDPYTFPTEIPVCVKGKCSSTTIGDDGDGKINLCDKNSFGPLGSGWNFVDNLPGGPQEECYWRHDDSAPATITSGKWGLKEMKSARLVFSHRWHSPSTQMLVYISNNDFQNCSIFPGTGCRIVKQFPHDPSHVELRDAQYRTEILDVSEFDHAEFVQVRFEVTKVTGAGTGGMDVFDPIIIGWKG